MIRRLLGRNPQVVEDVLLIRRGESQLVKFGIEFWNPNSIPAKRPKVRENVVETLHGIVVVSATL